MKGERRVTGGVSKNTKTSQRPKQAGTGPQLDTNIFGSDVSSFHDRTLPSNGIRGLRGFGGKVGDEGRGRVRGVETLAC
ncbi:hypothetical protein J6590_036047 [Homalodisca vitripennis]|nr:hypothetical protein J6590_036047 [Homalodisca vitripennis]